MKYRENDFRFLPFKFKKIGLGLILIMPILMLVSKAAPDYFMVHKDFIKLIAMDSLVMGLLVLGFSQEKVDDELLRELRIKSMAFAFIFGVVVFIVQSFWPFFDAGGLSILDAKKIVLQMLIIFNGYYLFKKSSL